MKKSFSNLFSIIISFSLIIFPSIFYANPPTGILNSPKVKDVPIITPTPPSLNAKAFILIDADSGKIIAEKSSSEKLPPASLTKVMTLYVINNALKSNQIDLNDTVRISNKAWKTGGSRMFVKEGQSVSIEDLIKGIIVDSGNDACVAMSEHLGGSTEGFADIMNQQAKLLGMADSHFTDSTGLPNSAQYSTAKDLAVLARAIVKDFPEYYHWYKQKWFTFNGIRQPNRNRLLWRDSQVDGIKTGHTDKAGYCQISSAKRDGMRLIAVVLGSPNEASRADDSERLLNYGFRFYETHELYKPGATITTLPVYKSKQVDIQLGVLKSQFITIPNGQYERLSFNTKIPKHLIAPIKQGEKIGDLIIKFDDQVISTKPLYAMQSAEQGGLFTRVKDGIKLALKNWF